VRIVGVSGAQGGGKSSLLNELKLRGYQVDDFRVSRAVQAQLGWDSLDRVMDKYETMKEFQNEVFNQKLRNDSSFKKNGTPGMILTERTFADIFAYTQTWVYKFIDRGEADEVEGLQWLTSYYKKCQSAQLECYAGTILLPLMPHVVFENDPHRAKREDADRVFEEITRFCDVMKYRGHQSFYITEKSVQRRADEMESFLHLVEKP